MKKLFALLMILMIGISTALAEEWDMSVFQTHPEYYISDTWEGDTNQWDPEHDLFISTLVETELLEFSHPYEHPDYYSLIFSDVYLAVDDMPLPQYFFRLWVIFESTKPLSITAVTFTFGGVSYTVDAEFAPEDIRADEDGYHQTICIVLGLENVDFMCAMANYINTESINNKQLTIPVILHGTEDLAIEMPTGSLLDYWLMMTGFVDAHGMQYLTLGGNVVTIE